MKFEKYCAAFKPAKHCVPTESPSFGADPDWMSWAGAYEGDMMLTEEQVRQLNDVRMGK